MIVIRDHGQFSRPTPADNISINPRCMPIASAVADFSHNIMRWGNEYAARIYNVAVWLPHNLFALPIL